MVDTMLVSAGGGTAGQRIERDSLRLRYQGRRDRSLPPRTGYALNAGICFYLGRRDTLRFPDYRPDATRLRHVGRITGGYLCE